ncbi:unnamed protein product [Clonostachys byssicola]|uniref:Uncharacterized protein n=1 Tax=Clonostachys byssicola TaxID=160290 RepID=A0A9N9UE70_9HYPO|nr:unnamed protein product [Clonostachys byssicola]
MDVEATIESVPYDIMLVIAELCTRDVRPLDNGPPSSYARYHAAMARTSKYFHSILNRALYVRNIRKDPPVDSCVLWAARKGNLGTIQRAHEYGADLDATGARDETDYDKSWASIPGRIRYFASPLHLAIKNDYPSIVQYLLFNGVDVHSQARNLCGCQEPPFSGKCYPLHIALAYEDEEGSGTDYAGLLVQHGAHKIADDVPALADLARAGRLDLVDTLIQREDHFSVTAALHYAISKQDLGLVDNILARDGADAGAKNWKRYGPLHIAISEATDDLSIINRLLQRPEVDASDVTPGWETPLHIAASKGRTDIANVLLERSDVNPVAETLTGLNALHLAVQSGRKDMVDVVLAIPHFPVGAVDADGMSALHHVCRTREDTDEARAILESLISHPDIHLDLVSNHGTPLFMAVKNRNFTIAAALVRAGSNINPPSPAQALAAPASLLHECLLSYSEGQAELVHELIQHGADVNLMTPFHGKDATPLFFAAAFANNVDAVRMLLEAGANIHCLVRDLWVPFESCMTLITAILETFFDRCHPGHLRRESIGALSACLELLLEYGAVLGLPSRPSEDNFHSALHCAMQMTAAGYQDILDVLLRHSEARNISEDYLDDFITGQIDMTRQGLIPRASLEKLMEFRTRIFPRKRSQSWNDSSYADLLISNSLHYDF